MWDFKTANFGVDPFQSLAMGLWSKNRNVDRLWNFYLLLNLLILLVDFILDRHYIGLATFINMFLVGYIRCINAGIENISTTTRLF